MVPAGNKAKCLSSVNHTTKKNQFNSSSPYFGLGKEHFGSTLDCTLNRYFFNTFWKQGPRGTSVIIFSASVMVTSVILCKLTGIFQPKEL